ncbi:MAG TPA: hypothetical protein VEN79_06810, partial [Terriglobia bacterium]|nr:hypothetical protein [Terriglobia bacterium]
TLPRRVYTQAHMDVVAESVLEVYEQREQACGLRMTFEPKYLRFFQARFAPLATAPAPQGPNGPGKGSSGGFVAPPGVENDRDRAR